MSPLTAVTEIIQFHDPVILLVVIRYCVVALHGGVTARVPTIFERRIFPGDRIPVEAFCSDQERVVVPPLTSVIGLAERVHEGTIGGGAAGDAVTEVLQLVDQKAFITESVYFVVASTGGMTT